MSNLNSKISYQKLKYLITGNIEYGIVGNVNNSFGIRYVRISDIDSNGLLKNINQQYFSNISDIPANKFIKPNDVLLACAGATIGKSYLHNEVYKDQLMTYASFLVRVRADRKKLHPKFFYYYTLSSNFEDWKNTVNVQSTIQNLSATKYANLLVPVFELGYQQKIVDFLDWKVNEIDKLSFCLNNKITKLHEICTQLITKEFDKCTSEIKLKYLLDSSLVYGINGTGKFEGSIRFIRITDIDKDGSLKEKNKLFINKCEDKFILKYKDILFARSGSIGRTFFYNKTLENTPMAFAGYLIRGRFDLNKVVPEFVYYFTLSQKYDDWKNNICIQSTIANISAEKYKNLKIPYTSLEQQVEIVKNIQSISDNFKQLINIYKKQIELLLELKQALITEVVTGKRNVQDVIIPEYEKFIPNINLSDIDDESEDGNDESKDIDDSE